MEKPYLLIKYFIPDTYYKTYATSEEALVDSKHSEAFPGNVLAVYNLDKKHYVHFEKLSPVLEEKVKSIVEFFKAN